MFVFEGLVLAAAGGWFVLLAAAPAGRDRTIGLSAAAATAVLVGATALAAPLPLRVWVPHLYIVAGYWLPALTLRARAGPTPAVSPRFQAWLDRTEAIVGPRLPQMPAALRVLTELAYLGCYPLVPIAFGLVWRSAPVEDAVRFWDCVLLAGYACYSTLPWLVSRPPRLAGAPVTGPGVRAVNAFVLGRVSHHLNTFPSGHVAVSAAAAWSTLPAGVEAGAAVAIFALLIAAGAAAGRYHYVVDVVAGLLVALAAAVITW